MKNYMLFRKVTAFSTQNITISEGFREGCSIFSGCCQEFVALCTDWCQRSENNPNTRDLSDSNRPATAIQTPKGAVKHCSIVTMAFNVSAFPQWCFVYWGTQFPPHENSFS